MTKTNILLPRSVTVPMLAARKGKRVVVMVTAYDAFQGQIADASGTDSILVGDSVGMTTLGYDSTLPVTLDDMVRHTRAVARGQATRASGGRGDEPFDTERGGRAALLVADLPFGSYGADPADGVRAGMRLIAEGGAQSVKIEGAGASIRETIRRLVDVGVPVMGHLGLTPQSVHRFGGFKVQGKGDAAADALLADAQSLVDVGAWGIVLEMIPAALAKRVTEAVPVLTIGIGAGGGCDGQVQVLHDILGLTGGPVYRHTRRYVEGSKILGDSLREHVSDVREGRFPTDANSF